MSVVATCSPLNCELHIVTSYHSHSRMQNACYISSCVCIFVVLTALLAVPLTRPLIAGFLSFRERIVDRKWFLHDCRLSVECCCDM